MPGPVRAPLPSVTLRRSRYEGAHSPTRAPEGSQAPLRLPPSPPPPPPGPSPPPPSPPAEPLTPPCRMPASSRCLSPARGGLPAAHPCVCQTGHRRLRQPPRAVAPPPPVPAASPPLPPACRRSSPRRRRRRSPPPANTTSSDRPRQRPLASAPRLCSPPPSERRPRHPPPCRHHLLARPPPLLLQLPASVARLDHRPPPGPSPPALPRPDARAAPGRVRAATPLEPGDAALPQPSLARPRPLLPWPHAPRELSQKSAGPRPTRGPVSLPQTRARVKAWGA